MPAHIEHSHTAASGKHGYLLANIGGYASAPATMSTRSPLPPDPLDALGLPPHWAGIVPNGRYRHLVSAALGVQDPLRSWSAYLDRLGATTPDDGEIRLFPFVARHLNGVGESVPRAAWLAASRRATILRTTALLRMATALSRHLHEASIPFSYSKGVALTARVYRRSDLRRFADIDIHIPQDHADAIFALARKSGWAVKGVARTPHAAMFAAIGASTFVTSTGGEIDVHWRPRRAFAWLPAWNERFRASGRPVAWQGEVWPVPSDTWLLIETLEHGMQYNRVCPIRWVIDAHALLSCDDVEIDWAMVAAAGAGARIRPALCHGLEILAALGAPIPSEAIADLRSAGWLERLNFRWRMRPRSTTMTIVDEILHYLLRGPGSRIERLVRLPQYLRVDSFEYPAWRDLWWRLRRGARRPSDVAPR